MEVSQLTKFYGDFQAIKGVSFTAHRGEPLGFLGPNGAARRTLLIGSAAQLDHYAHRAGSSIVYLIDDAAYRQIAKSPADFLPVAEQTAAASKTQQ